VVTATGCRSDSSRQRWWGSALCPAVSAATAHSDHTTTRNQHLPLYDRAFLILYKIALVSILVERQINALQQGAITRDTIRDVASHSAPTRLVYQPKQVVKIDWLGEMGDNVAGADRLWLYRLC
jgi:hypothetical protein